MATDDSHYPATPMQIGMLLRNIAEPELGENIVQVRITMEDNLNIPQFVEAWHEVIRRHECMRTVFAWEGMEHPIQRICDTFEPEFVILDWTHLTDSELAVNKTQLLAQDRQTGYDLSAKPPIRFYLAKQSNAYWFFWSVHHIILDGRSYLTVGKEAFDLYDAQGELPIRARPPFSLYAQHVNSIDHDGAKAFWQHKLATVETDTFIPLNPSLTNDTEPSKYTAHNAAAERDVPAELSDQLRAFGKQQRVGVVTLLQGAWAILLHHYSQQSTVVFGTTRALRQTVDGALDMVGLLINTVPSCVQITPEITLGELLTSIRQEQKNLRLHETTPLPIIAQCSAIGSKTLFDSLVVYDEKTFNSRWHEAPSPQPQTRSLIQENQTNYPLALLAFGEHAISIRLEYQLAHYSQQLCERLLDQLLVLLSSFIANAETAAVNLPYLTEPELKQLTYWNASDRPYDLEQTLHSLFQRQVARTPEAIALSTDNQSLSYRQFNEQANQLARHLQQSGVKADVVVGVYAERSLEMMIALYAIVKAGGAYLPLDPSHPADRVAFMVADSGINLILTQSKFRETLAFADVAVLAIDETELWQKHSSDDIDTDTQPHHLAYMLYTSGSTGKPKGALIEHRSIVNRLLWMQEAFALTPAESVLQKTPYTFDVSVWELFWPLQIGARLFIAKPEGHKDTDYLATVIRRENITTTHFVPSMLQLFCEEPTLAQCHSLRRIICSGEALTTDLQNRLLDQLDVELHNLYGPTEAAVDVTWWHCDRNSQLPFVPIGKTIANTQIHILDKNMNPLPVGVPGELYIAGVQVGRGYHNRAELDAERFVANPFNKQYKMYRTGDLARMMPDGNVEYLGRLDFQVKIRGQRIELGEIEAILSNHHAVKQAVVTVELSTSGQQQIAAFVIADADTTDDMLRTHCAHQLPEHMVPELMVRLDELPLNASGKVDRKQLPAAQLQPTDMDQSQALPSNETEAAILAIWHDVLGNASAGTNDPFFDVGGNSLLLLRLSNRLAEAFGAKFPIQQLLKSPTVAAQALYLQTPANDKDTSVENAARLAERQKAARGRRRQLRR